MRLGPLAAVWGLLIELELLTQRRFPGGSGLHLLEPLTGEHENPLPFFENPNLF